MSDVLGDPLRLAAPADVPRGWTGRDHGVLEDAAASGGGRR
jgi:hypothetical protein